MKSVLIGSVHSSRVVLEELIRAGSPPVMVYSLDEAVSQQVSGYYPLHDLAERNKIPYRKFKKISDVEYIQEIQSIAPDYIFVVGLSQLVDEGILSAASQGVVGLHPAPLPKYRGRAALVWQVLLDVRETAVTLFLIDRGMDSGPIIGQEPFLIQETDYAQDIEASCLNALRKLCRRVIPQMELGTLVPLKQDETQATYLLKRTPEDGKIDWTVPIREIHRLIRAVSKPYPGAFSHYDGRQLVTIWRAEIEENTKYIGIPGQIAEKDKSSFAVVCKDGLLRVTDYTCEEPVQLLVGHKLRDKGEIR